jgi:outer membrane protein OmpA-like peptidoglycan-associated protein
MTNARQIAVLLGTLAATLTLACGPKHISAPTRPGQSLVVLLADAETGSTGRARVRNKSGSAELTAAGDATLVKMNRQVVLGTLSEADVARLFGEVISALPPVPRRFTLYFLFESDDLTDDSRALVPEILTSIKERFVQDIVMVGHTDTMGTPQANYELGLKRAMFVRELLVLAGLDGSTIAGTSHGEAELLSQTLDETPEPRNRRVDIVVR